MDYYTNQLIAENNRECEDMRRLYISSDLVKASDFCESLIKTLFDAKEEIIKLKEEVERLSREKEDTNSVKNRDY